MLCKSDLDNNFYVVEVPMLEDRMRLGQGQIMVLAQETAPSKGDAKTSFADTQVKGAAAGTIVYHRLSQADKAKFDESRDGEGHGLAECGAVTVLSLADSLAFEAADPDAVVDSLWVDRWKHTEDGDIAKSRWCVVGWQDPDIHEIERSSPMPQDATLNSGGQIIATRKWRLKFRDVRKAFGQSLPSNRKRKLACRQPRTGAFPGCTDPRQLILLETEVYGLVSGPAWWRITFVKHFTDRGYVMNRCDPCALVLPGDRKESPTSGVAILEMDDVLEGGDERHEALMQDMSTVVQFGKTRICMEPAGTLFNGRRWYQDKHFNIHYTTWTNT